MSNVPPRQPGPAFPPMEIPPDLISEYINLVRIAHSPSELVFDFAQWLPGAPAVMVKSRIVMSPLGAKLFFRALEENLAKYEAAYGEIRMPSGSNLAEELFRPSPPPDKPT